MLGGCASTASLFDRAGKTSVVEPWSLAPEAYPTQRLYRVKYRGTEGDLGFKLTLYLESQAKFRMLASDLGRKFWSLTVDGDGEAAWIDYRRKETCRAPSSDRLRFVTLADLPLMALPKLLLGRLPAEPAASLRQDEGRVAFLDARGQLWNAGLSAGELDWWSLIEAGEVVVWWRREDDGGVFSDSENRQEVRWREIVREELKSPLTPLAAPSGYQQVSCDSSSSR